ncbi:CAP domain-containing protein [Streptomyces sp. NPDC004787]|uniref:CAP domain-containing protein n=1 Tax=Streptomyces sp. NPDC004787 TaxID=3154291 RepID=UPI0033BE37F4
MRHDAYDTPARPSPFFRTAMTAAGTLAAAVTVLTGVYAADQGRGGGPGPVVGAAPAAAVRTVPAVRGAGSYGSEVVDLVNAERRKAGCPPVRSDPRLRAAAQRHADDMAARNYYAHAGRDGRDAGDRIRAAGYAWSAWGENIHRGPHSAAQAVDEWMNSAAHRQNILDCSFEDIGVGVNLTGNGPWWVQDFAAGR